MITEIPDPACVPSSSPFAAMAANSRSVFSANAATAIGSTVAIKGVGFFDNNTLTSNVAPNKIELHPVLDINFNPGSPPPANFFTMNASPSTTSVMQGHSTTTSISTQVTSGSSQSVNLSASGLPAGTYGCTESVARRISMRIQLEDCDTGGIGGTLAGNALSLAAMRATLEQPTGQLAPTADVYVNEMPGGQYTNLFQQAQALGLESRWREVCRTGEAGGRPEIRL